MQLTPLTEEQKQLASDHFPRVYKFLSKRIGEGEDWDEMFSACMEGLCQAARKHDESISKMSTYSYIWMRSKISHIRRSKARSKTINMSSMSDDGDADKYLAVTDDVSKNDHSDFEKLISCLHSDQKDLVRKMFIEGYGLADIAKIKGITRQGVAHQLERCKRRLRIHARELGLVKEERK